MPDGRVVTSASKLSSEPSSVDLETLDLNGLRLQWRNLFGCSAPAGLPRSLLYRMLVYRQQEERFGSLSVKTKRLLSRLATDHQGFAEADASPSARVAQATAADRTYSAGTILVREWKGKLHRVTVLKEGFAWNGQTFASLSRISREITGINWNGHVFFGGRKKALKTSVGETRTTRTSAASGCDPIT